MSIGEQKANTLESIGKDFAVFIKTRSRTKMWDKNNEALEKKKVALKEICKKHEINFDKVWKIFITN